MARFNTDLFGTSAWRNARNQFLTINPMCSVAGCGERAVDVDHAQSRASGGAHLDPSNFVGYCRSHHSAKTVAVDGGFGGNRSNPDFKQVVRGCNKTGVPKDPEHHWNKG